MRFVANAAALAVLLFSSSSLVASVRRLQEYKQCGLCKYFDPSTNSCEEFPNCHESSAIEELAWDCGPCSAFFLDGGNGHCERAPGCSLSGGGAAATVLATGRQRGAQQQQQQATRAASAASSAELKQISDVADRNAVVHNLGGRGSVTVGMPPTAGRARRASSSSAGAASAPSSSRPASSSTRSPSATAPAVDAAAASAP